MKQEKGRIGMLNITKWTYGGLTASVREGRYVEKELATSSWGNQLFHRNLYPVDIVEGDIPIWEEAAGNYVRFKINSGGKAVLYYNPKKRL